MKEIQVTVTQYQSEDGQMFNSKIECLQHEEFLSGKRRICPLCEGTGKIDPYGDGREFVKCAACEGKGSQVRSEVWT